MKPILCENCGAKIPLQRLKFLPDTTTCVKCSDTQPYSEDQILGSEISESQTENKLNAEEFESVE